MNKLLAFPKPSFQYDDMPAGLDNLDKSQRIEIDFETRSRVDVTNVGAWKYSQHPSTTVLCFSYIYPENPNKSYLWTPEMRLPTRLIRELYRPDRGIEAHNAAFEYAIWNNVLVPQFGFPRIHPNKIYCSASKAAQCALPSKLEKVAKVLELPYQKDMDGHRVMLKLSKPRNPSKKNPASFHHIRDDFEKMYSYCRMDTLTEKALSNALPDLPAFERKVWLLDQEMNRRGVYIDIDAVLAAQSLVAEGKARAVARFNELVEGCVPTPKSPNLKNYLNQRFDMDMPNMQAATVEEWIKYENIHPVAKEILEIKALIGKSSTAKLDTMLTMVCADGRVHDLLFYHAATTGRWGGRGIQPQNFPRGHLKYDQVVECIADIKTLDYDDFSEKWGNPFAAISSCLRGMLRAAPGKILRAADYSAIEARGVAWLAGEDKALAIFHNGGDIYVDMAATIYGVRHEDVTPDQRQMGKQAILGLGYQMGADKFMATCESYGIEITKELATRVVKTYRKKYAKIVQFWYDMERAAVKAVATGKVTRAGKIQFGVKGDFLLMRLPSGRFLYYHKPHLVRKKASWGEEKTQLAFYGVDSKTKQYVRQYTYGGKLVENATQATARDVMTYNMLNAEELGYELLFTVHDELVSETDENFGTLEEFENALSQVPPWATGFPVAAEGWEGQRYRKG